MSELTTVNSNQVAAQSSDNMASMFMSMAMNPECDVDKLEKLMALYERDEARKSKVAFSKDFAEMQSELPTVAKSKTVSFKKDGNGNPITAYKHATLEDIVDVVRPVLQTFGFAASFSVNTIDKVSVTCTLMHKEGHSIETTITLKEDQSGGKNGVQAIGSSVSYGKRYTLASLLNIATRDDDDAEAAMQKDNRFITANQSKSLDAKFNQLPKERQDKFIDWLGKNQGVGSIPEVNVSGFNAVMSALNKVIASLDKDAA
ncbi:MAG: ERF family protein [Psychrobacter alimentarius]